MPGIKSEDIRRVREATDIVSVFAERCVLQRKGRVFWCCCPFHDERTPSCKVDPDTQLFYCFGCHEGGDAINYVMKAEDIDFRDAVMRLAERAGIEIEEGEGRSFSRSYKARLKDICRESCEFFHSQLMHLRSPEADAARAYLAGRGMGGTLPKRWRLGFAPGRGSLMRHLRSMGFSIEEMTDANVVSVSGRDGRARDRFYDRIMFPICDEQGECIAFGGRVVGRGEPKYLNTSDTPLFGKSRVLYGLDRAKAAMTATGTAVVVEGYTDVIALHEAGMDNAVATLGTALTKQHLRAISRHAGKRIVYLFDGDEAGQRAADRALGFIGESVTPESGRARRELCACTLPDGLDPADFVARHGIDALRALVDEAPPLISYGVDRTIARHNTDSAEGRAAAFADAVSLLAPIKDSVLAQDYAVQIAGRLHMREETALDRLAALKAPRARLEPGVQGDGGPGCGSAVQPFRQTDEPERGADVPETERNRRRFERAVLSLCAREPRIALAHADTLAGCRWHSDLHAGIAERLLGILTDDPDTGSRDLIARVKEDLPQSTRVFMEDVGESCNHEELAAYLCEELSIGDAEEEIARYRESLKEPGAFSEEDYDLMFRMVSSMQRDLVELKKKHAVAIL